ncbi:MAG: LUD domain-containing protein [Anaerolineae bacterium]
MARQHSEVNMIWREIPELEVIQRAAAALTANGMQAIIVPNGAEAKARALEIIPAGALVMTSTSMTTSQIGLQQEIDDSGRYVSARSLIQAQSTNTETRRQARRRYLASDWMVGSVHAVTEDGQALVGSMTGSQLPLSAYSTDKVLWVVGAQKIVPDLAAAWRRLREYSLLREDERMRQAGAPGSALNKVLLISREVVPDRIHVILVQEELGF